MPSESYLQKFLSDLYLLVYHCSQEIHSLHSQNYISEVDSETKLPTGLISYLSNPDPSLSNLFKPMPLINPQPSDTYNDSILDEIQNLIQSCESLNSTLQNSNHLLQVSTRRVLQYQEAIKSLLLL